MTNDFTRIAFTFAIAAFATTAAFIPESALAAIAASTTISVAATGLGQPRAAIADGHLD